MAGCIFFNKVWQWHFFFFFLNILNCCHCLSCSLSSVLSWHLVFSSPSSAPRQLCPSVKTVSLSRSPCSLAFSLSTPALFLSLCLSCWGLCRRTVSFSACSPPASCCCEPRRSQTEVESLFLCECVCTFYVCLCWGVQHVVEWYFFFCFL